MKLTCSLVLTTIFDPTVLDDYYNNFNKFGHLDQVKIFLIPDRKTPQATYERCKKISTQGLRTECPNIQEQEMFLNRIGFPSELIPYDSDNRRNVGYLMALESGSDFIISIDDDNFCLPNEDFFAAHAIVCAGEQFGVALQSKNRWYNICELLEFDRSGWTYPRGFPYYARHQSPNITRINEKIDVHVNAGLWLQDPDVDGISWLVNPVSGKKFKGESITLNQTTWSPVNTQNTGLNRKVIPSYYFVKMRYPLIGVPIDRYGDIFSGYFSQACVKHLGGNVHVGTPIAEHKRNSHNYLNDASNEWSCILVLEDMLHWLTEESKLSGSTYAETYTSLSYVIEDAVEKFQGKIWTDATRGYFHQMGYCMRKWVSACKQIM
jgi:hypothetical protein